jgi:hypothetical protein
MKMVDAEADGVNTWQKLHPVLPWVQKTPLSTFVSISFLSK